MQRIASYGNGGGERMTRSGEWLRGFCFIMVAWMGVNLAIVPAVGGDTIRVGLNADLTSADAESGEAIRRGALVAMAEINDEGGVLGRRLELVPRDHRRNPARGIDNLKELAAMEDVVAVLGGKHTPVVLAELPLIHELGLPYLIPWAAGTAIVDNGQDPNFVFRVSVRDELAGGFLMDHAVERHGYRRIGLLLEQTGWGRSSEVALKAGLARHGLEPCHVEWFNWGKDDFEDALVRFDRAGAEVIVFVGNAPDGAGLARALIDRSPEKRLPVISHWGVAGGDFAGKVGADLDGFEFGFLQTFSFFDPPFPDRADRFMETWRELFSEEGGIEQIAAPAGVAHAYDLVHLLAKALAQAGEPDRAKVRDELERIGRHEGLVRNYDPPFGPDRHDALDVTDYCIAQFEKGVIVLAPCWIRREGRVP